MTKILVQNPVCQNGPADASRKQTKIQKHLCCVVYLPTTVVLRGVMSLSMEAQHNPKNRFS